VMGDRADESEDDPPKPRWDMRFAGLAMISAGLEMLLSALAPADEESAGALDHPDGRGVLAREAQS
jgi:hypothetical protein